MAKFEYPITGNYIANKGLDFALQELISNGLDAQTAHGAEFAAEYDVVKKRLVLRNRGITLRRETLLFGESGSRGDPRLIGQHGEGMKLALLILAREGLPTRVKNGRHEDWRPYFEFHMHWGAKILQLDVTKAKRQVEDFEVEIHGVEAALWNRVHDNYLRLFPPHETRDCDVGQVLLDADRRGKIYVKGVFNSLVDTLGFGYNLLDVDTSRDRDTVEPSALRRHIATIWREIGDRGETQDIERIAALLARDGIEGEGIRTDYSGRTCETLARWFRDQHGENVAIAQTAGEVVEAEHCGIVAVAVPYSLYYVLQDVIPTVRSQLASRRYDVVKTYDLAELDEAERRHLLGAAGRLCAAAGFEMGRVAVVDFRDAKVRGVHEGRDIRISRATLKTAGQAMRVLIHEFAHDRGDDGSASHADRIQALWEKVYEYEFARTNQEA